MTELAHDVIAERVGGAARNQDIARWASSIDTFFISGEEQHFYIPNEAKQQEFIDLIGHTEVTSGQIIYWNYEATAYESMQKSGDSYQFRGVRTISSIQERLGDVGMNLEFPNDFKVQLVVSLDNEAAIIYSFESSSSPVVCEACRTSTNSEVREEIDLNPDYSCRHCVDDYSFRYGAALVFREDIVEKAVKLARF